MQSSHGVGSHRTRRIQPSVRELLLSFIPFRLGPAPCPCSCFTPQISGEIIRASMTVCGNGFDSRLTMVQCEIPCQGQGSMCQALMSDLTVSQTLTNSDCPTEWYPDRPLIFLALVRQVLSQMSASLASGYRSNTTSFVQLLRRSWLKIVTH